MRTQKLVTTTATNALGEQVKFRMCSEPSQQAKDIYRKLGYKEAPYKKNKKFVGHTSRQTNPQAFV